MALALLRAGTASNPYFLAADVPFADMSFTVRLNSKLIAGRYWIAVYDNDLQHVIGSGPGSEMTMSDPSLTFEILAVICNGES